MKITPVAPADRYATPNKNPRLTLQPVLTKKPMHEVFEELLHTQKRVLGG